MLVKNIPSFWEPAQAFSKASLYRQLLPTMTQLRSQHWVVAFGVTVVAGVFRFFRLGDPHALVFDETYYVKEGYSLLQSGYERAWEEGADEFFNQGDFSKLTTNPAYVVHPPVGKWLIAFGMRLLGPESAYGWRLSAAVVGSLSVLCIVLIAVKLFSSTLLAGLAGFYLAVDGHHLVQSRTAILDIFLSFFIVFAFLFLLFDRENGRKQLIRHLTSDGIPSLQRLRYGPVLWWRPWRLGATVCLALAAGTKWSALSSIAVFCIMTVLWDMNARRVAGVERWLVSAFFKDGLVAFFQTIPLMAFIYLTTWYGWFLSGGQRYQAWDRDWAANNPGQKVSWLPDALASLWHYHQSAYAFHNGLHSAHRYASQAWQWLPMIKPTSYYYRSPVLGEEGCVVDSCSVAINNIANPVIWWAASSAVILLGVFWLVRHGFPAWLSQRHNWRTGAILSGVLGGYIPWLFYPERTIYFFYAVSFEPFMVLALVFCFAMMFGGRTDKELGLVKGAGFYGHDAFTSVRKVVDRRKHVLLGIAVFTVVVLLISAFFYPIWTAETIPWWYWRIHMWFPSWI